MTQDRFPAGPPSLACFKVEKRGHNREFYSEQQNTYHGSGVTEANRRVPSMGSFRPISIHPEACLCAGPRLSHVRIALRVYVLRSTFSDRRDTAMRACVLFDTRYGNTERIAK